MSKPHDTQSLLSSIDQKLTALVAMAVADRLPETALAKSRSLDGVLRAAGLEVSEIASLMGKTTQAVRQRLDADQAQSKPTGRAKAKADG